MIIFRLLVGPHTSMIINNRCGHSDFLTFLASFHISVKMEVSLCMTGNLSVRFIQNE